MILIRFFNKSIISKIFYKNSSFLIFFIGLKTRLKYILRIINANNLKLKFFEFLGKLIYKEIILYKINLIKRFCKKKKKKKKYILLIIIYYR